MSFVIISNRDVMNKKELLEVSQEYSFASFSYKKWRNFNICPNYILLITLSDIFHNDATFIPVITCLCKLNELDGFNENFIYRRPRQSLSFVCQSIIFQALYIWIFSGGNFVVEFPFCVKPRPSFLIFLGFIPLGCGNYFLVYIFERCSPASSSKEPFLSKIRYNFRNQQFA